MNGKRVPTVEGYTTNNDRELHYYKSRVSKAKVLADKRGLTPGWWKLHETKKEYVLKFDEAKARQSFRKKKPFGGLL